MSMILDLSRNSSFCLCVTEPNSGYLLGVFFLFVCFSSVFKYRAAQTVFVLILGFSYRFSNSCLSSGFLSGSRDGNQFL